MDEPLATRLRLRPWAETDRVPFAAMHADPVVMQFMPAVLSDHWGQGYAVEAARAICKRAFDDLGIDELVSFTVPENSRSRRVMDAAPDVLQNRRAAWRKAGILAAGTRKVVIRDRHRLKRCADGVRGTTLYGR